MKGWVALPMCLLIAGCAALDGYPKQPTSLAMTVNSLDADTLKARIAQYNSQNTAESDKMAIRNEIIYSTIAQIDQSFDDFKVALNSQENMDTIGADFVSLALAGVGATTGNAATKAALAAASAGVLGAKAAIDRDVLYKNTISALTTEMEAQRSVIFARLITNMKSSTVVYPLEATSKDLEDYYQAGTLVNAIQGISQSASAKAQAGTDQVAAALSGTYSYDDTSKKIESFWMPDGKTPNKVNGAKIQSCMTQNQIIGSIPFLINAGKASDKSKILACVNM